MPSSILHMDHKYNNEHMTTIKTCLFREWNMVPFSGEGQNETWCLFQVKGFCITRDGATLVAWGRHFKLTRFNNIYNDEQKI